jgi:hypothetical protein
MNDDKELNYIISKYSEERFPGYGNKKLIVDTKRGKWVKFRLYNDKSMMLKGRGKDNKLIIEEQFEYYLSSPSKLNYDKIVSIEAFNNLINSCFEKLDINFMSYRINDYKETFFKFNKDNYKKKLKKLNMEFKLGGK